TFTELFRYLIHNTNSGSFENLHYHPDFAGFGPLVSPGLLHLHCLLQLPGWCSVRDRCTRPNLLLARLSPRLCTSLQCLWTGDFAGTGFKRNRACRRTEPRIPSGMLSMQLSRTSGKPPHLSLIELCTTHLQFSFLPPLQNRLHI
ncbi:hypothetical protein P879_08213, partial [Paragonimus westermani]